MTAAAHTTSYGPRGERFVRVHGVDGVHGADGADGVPLHVVVEGSGPPVVLSAGLAMAWFDWDPVAALLVAQGRTVVRFDRPGHGLSGPATAPPTAAGEARRIAGLLDALGLGGRPATVAGHSIAGFHAEAFARLYPERTAALVLVDSSIEEDPRTVLPAGLRTGAAGLLGRALTAAGLPAALGPLARRAAVRASRTGGSDPAARDLVRRVYRTGRVWRGALLENARYQDTAADLLALRTGRPPAVPVTVLAGYDGSAGRGALRWCERQAELAERLGARFEVVEPSGHLVMLDRPGEVARAVLDAGVRESGGAGGPGGGGSVGWGRSAPRVDLLHEARQLLLGEVLGQVGLADHADQLLVPDDRQALDLVALHLLQDVGDVRARVDPARGALGHVTAGDLRRVVPLGHTVHDDVAVGEDAAQPLVGVADGQGAHIEPGHQLGGPVEGLGGRDPLGPGVHDVCGGRHR